MWSGLWKNLKSFKIEVLIFSFSIALNVAALHVFWDDALAFTSSGWKQVEYAYTFYKKNTLFLNHYDISKRQHVIEEIKERERPVSPSIHDTVAYGFLLGLLWKIFDYPSLIYIQLLQIFLFSLTLVFLYRFLLSYLVPVRALICIACMFLYVPLIHMNIVPGRDIWSFYGGVVLLYIFSKILYEGCDNYFKVVLAGLFFAFCQFIRPNIFFQLLTLFLAIFFVAYFWHRSHIKVIVKSVVLIIMANSLLFWMPFLLFNKIAYDQFFVSVSGHDLVQSLSTVDNPWGLKFSDEDTDRFIQSYYPGVEYATVQYGIAGNRLFLDLLKDHWGIYLHALKKSFSQAYSGNMPVTFRLSKRYEFYDSIRGVHRIKTIINQQGLLEAFFFFARLYFVRFAQFLGYIGLLIALFFRKERELAVLCFFGIVVGMSGKLLSHCEARYVVPFYWPMAIFTGLFLAQVVSIFVFQFRKAGKKIWSLA